MTCSPAAGRRAPSSRLIALLFAALVTSVAHADYAPPIPAQLLMRVENTSAYAQSGFVVRSGVPLPRASGLTSVAGFAVVDDGGGAVPATFRVLARWNAGRDVAAAPIQWVLVSFPADVAAGAARNYRLVVDGSVVNPPPAPALVVTAQGQQLEVATGVATFRIGAEALAPFDLARYGAGDTTVVGGSAEVVVDGTTVAAASDIRRIELVQQDALSAVIVTESELDAPLVGGGRLALTRRYEFRAGSPIALVRAWLDWEGDRCGQGVIECAGQVNAVRIERWREGLDTFFGTTPVVAILGDREAPLATSAWSPGQSAYLRQRRRAARTDPPVFEQRLPSGVLAGGTFADGGVVLAGGSEGVVAIALQRMDRYEPQALRVLADGALALDLADDGVWLGAKQGVAVEYALGVYPPGTAAGSIVADVWADRNAPLLALPEAAWVAATRAVEEIPVGPLPAPWDRFDAIVNDALDRTESERVAKGLYGLTTYGLFPRDWGTALFGDEIDCGETDPTPADDWDDTYWCSTWTDYHNAASNAVYAALRFGDARRLHQIAFPAARRMLHTQVRHCAPSDPGFFCGQSPTGYRGYRSDDNGSHQYWENLFLYYWLTGDETVWRTLERGARSLRSYFCPSRVGDPVGPVCAPNAPITDEFAGLNGRVAGQWFAAFRFVGLASDDVSYLDDWTSNTARMLTQNYAEVAQGPRLLGLLEPSGAGSTTIVTGAGTYYTTQLWMSSLYDMTALQRLDLDSQDQPLGVPAVTPRQVQTAFGRTLRAAAQVPPGDGTPAGVIPETLRFTFSGNRIGGTLTALEPGWAPGPMPMPCFDACLYPLGKAATAAALMRAADASGDAELRAYAEALALQAIVDVENLPQPLNKPTGIGLTRLHAAIARITASSTPPPLFADGFE